MNPSAGLLTALGDQRLLGWLVAALAALVLLAVGGWWWTKRKAPVADEEDRIDTLTGWPPQATRLMTTPERSAFRLLARAMPDYMVLSQVPLSRFINVPKRNSYAEWLRRVGNQTIDFLVCDMNSQVVGVVEIQLPAAQTVDRARRRQVRIARTLQAAGVPLHVWLETSLPSVEVARDSLLTRPLPAAPAPVAAPAPPPIVASTGIQAPPPPPAPQPGAPPPFNPFSDTGRDSTQDEMIEPQEPPPTTWYDEFDSGPTPLAPDKRKDR